MSNLKTATSALTAAVLVTGIGLAWAQSDEQTQPTEPLTAATAAPSEQTPADPNALTAVDTTAADRAATVDMTQQPMSADDPARTAPPVDTTAPLTTDATTRSTADGSYSNVNANATATSNADASLNATSTANDNMAPRSGYDAEPAPRADRN